MYSPLAAEPSKCPVLAHDSSSDKEINVAGDFGAQFLVFVFIAITSVFIIKRPDPVCDCEASSRHRSPAGSGGGQSPAFEGGSDRERSLPLGLKNSSPGAARTDLSLLLASKRALKKV